MTFLLSSSLFPDPKQNLVPIFRSKGFQKGGHLLQEYQSPEEMGVGISTRPGQRVSELF